MLAAVRALTDLAASGFAAAGSPEGRAWIAALPSLQAEAREFTTTLRVRQRQLHDPVPARWITLAARLAAGLAGDPARLLVHTDLHYGNILASRRPGQPWVAIDPAPAAGAPERSVAELLWTRADELPGPKAITGLLGTLVENGQLDRAKATAWGMVRSIDYWLWGWKTGSRATPCDASESRAPWPLWPSTATSPESRAEHDRLTRGRLPSPRPGP